MIKSLFPFLLLFNMVGVYAQQDNYNHQQNFLNANSYWVVDRGNIDFTRNPPLGTVNDSSGVLEGCASVADPVTGALLFYSNGGQCRDRNNNVMPNGDSLFGNGGGGTSGSTTQGVCIVPMIDSPGKYYLFSMSGFTDDSRASTSYNQGGSLFYSVVDMSLNGGMGDIVSSRKNIMLSADTFGEGMIAVPGNNCDIWLVIREGYKPVFQSFHITANGIDPNPVISRTGEQVYLYVMGHMAVSPDRERIAVAALAPFCYIGMMDSIAGVLLCKFDPSTGVVYDGIQVEKDLQTYGVAFSPDNSKLYIGNYDHLTDLTSIQQYDVSRYDITAINASKKMIASVGSAFQNIGTGAGWGTVFTYMRLYKDTIYFPNADYTNNSFFLSSINKPNLSGDSCDFQMASINLPDKSFLCLPNEVVYPIPPDTVHHLVMDTVICGSWENSIVLRPSLILGDYQYSWSNGSSDSISAINHSGKYWVSYTNGCHYKVDSFILRESELEQPVIRTEVFKLSTTLSYKTYQWMLDGSIITGATDSFYTVTQNGNYQVIVSDGTCTDTSDIYEVTNYSGIESLKDLADRISVYPNPVKDIIYVRSPIAVDIAIYSLDGRFIKEIKSAGEFMVGELSEGVYFLHFNDRNGTLIKVEKLVRLNAH